MANLQSNQVRWRHRLVAGLGIVTFLFGFPSVWWAFHFPRARLEFLDRPELVALVFFWTLGPPLWFLFEYFVLWKGADEQQLKQIKEWQDIAKPLWAAVLATVLFFIPK